MKDLELIELFDDFVQGRMDERTKIEFNSMLEGDPQFKEKYEEYFKTVELIRLEGFRNESKKELNRIKLNQKLQKLGLVILIIGFIIALFLLKPQTKESLETSNEDLFANYFEPYPNVFTFRSEHTNINEALEAYSLKEYELALNLFSQLEERNDIANFYAGVTSLIQSPEDRTGFKEFMNLIDSSSQFYQQKHWYMALSFLKDPIQIDSVKNYLKNIKLDEYKYKESQILLDQISTLD